MKKFHLTALLFSVLSIFVMSCDDEDPLIPQEEEVITTLTYTLVAPNGNTTTFSFQDLDGDGGNEPIITGGTLDSNTTYTGTLTLLNESENPAENITLEIQESDEEHQFFFSSTLDNLDIDYADEDENNKPVGLTTTVNTGETSSGVLTITLRHKPAKDEEGVANGDITNAGGETDIEVNFPVTIQ